MSNVIKTATNKFTKGLVMDFSPENTSNEVLTHALNATLLTFNGNEMSLQNDMGNGRVETAFLPEGYMPVGTCEYGGIIYIVSYNPLEDKSQIGCFPSPERNISSEELGIQTQKLLNSDFVDDSGNINTYNKKVLLKNDKLNPGDKFIITSDQKLYDNYIQGLKENNILKQNPIIKLNVVSIEDSGKIIYLNNDLINYQIPLNGTTYDYHILGNKSDSFETTIDIDSYRNVLSSGYNVFKSKTSGKLAILAELITIDSYSVTHSIVSNNYGKFDILIHTEISPDLHTEDYYQFPKLKYYYLKNSQGILQKNTDTFNLFEDTEYGSSINTDLNKLKLNEIFTGFENSSETFNTQDFKFPKKNTYYSRMIDSQITNENFNSSGEFVLDISKYYVKFTENKLHLFDYDQLFKPENNSSNFSDKFINYIHTLPFEYYKYTENGTEVPVPDKTKLEKNKTYYVQINQDKYIDAKRDESHIEKILHECQINLTDITDDKDLQDPTKDKYIISTETYYKKVSGSELSNAINNGLDIFFYNETTGKYETAINTHNSIDYYICETTQIKKFIGTNVNKEDYNAIKKFYYKLSESYIPIQNSEKNKYYDFDTYPKLNESPYGYPKIYYYCEQSGKTTYRIATEEELNDSVTQLYELTQYEYIDLDYLLNINEKFKYQDAILFIKPYNDTYVPLNYFVPNISYNKIYGINWNINGENYINEGPIKIQECANFIPELIESDKNEIINYNDVKLGSIQFPKELYTNKKGFPFKYDYTIVPCMEYGKLDYLSVSNTIDFNHIYDFEQSNFNIWKYHIDGDLLTLTVGAEIYDSAVDDKVDALILEFYDLYGFAGSLEISGKKSYSGTFTKSIYLKTFNELNKYQIIDKNTISSNVYNRNISISTKNDSNFYLNDKKLIEPTEDNNYNNNKGWVFEDNTELGELNDCGTLYNNIIYGVKPYIRQIKINADKSTSYIYTKKDDFFLFTIPLFNEAYYTTDNFNTITPSLELYLTYKMKEHGIKNPYSNSTYSITNGWNSEDFSKISLYKSGKSDQSDLFVTQYYQYSGITDLHLEIGLKQDYEKYNIAYLKTINDIFSCDLKLISNDDINKSYSVKSSDNTASSITSILNYNNLPDSINQIQLKGNTNFDTNNLFSLYNFSEKESHSLQIEYNFVIGYNISILNIVDKEIPATTVCALCHKQNDDTYNYEDFGIYLTDDNKYLCTNIFYNRGDISELETGLAKQINTSGTISDILQSHTNIITEPLYATPGKLNTHFLTEAAKHIGKLTFAQPHAHALICGNDSFNGDGTNLYKPNPNDTEYKVSDEEIAYPSTNNHFHITPHRNDWGDDILCGTFGTQEYAKAPEFNMSLNTKKSLLYYGEFISTIDYYVTIGGYWYEISKKYKGEYEDLKHPEDNKYVWAIQYYELTASQLEAYNKKLITTMKSVYAYNPDYNTYKVKVGDVSIENRQVQFISNLISSNATLNLSDTSFVDYLLIGTVPLKTYLSQLTKYSTIITKKDNVYLPNLNIQPDLKYCGKESFLVSQLTYNIPVPENIENDLTFTNNNQIIIKHHDGTLNFISGEINKRTLYGIYNLNKNAQTITKLVELDVSNYTIAKTGELTLKEAEVTKSISTILTNFDININNIMSEQKIASGVHNNINYEIYLDASCNTGSYQLLGQKNNILYFFLRKSDGSDAVPTFKLSFRVKPETSNQYTLRLGGTITRIAVDLTNRLDDRDNSNIDEWFIQEQPISTLDRILVAHSSRANTNNLVVDLYKNNSSTSVNLQNDFVIYNSVDFADNISGYNNMFDCSLKPTGIKGTGILVEVDIKNLIVFFDYKVNIYDQSDDLIVPILNKKTQGGHFKDYGQKGDDKTKGTRYEVKNEYKNSVIRYTNITLNDLVYDPFTENGHRLFVRDDCYRNSTWFRNQIFYREANSGDQDLKNNIMYMMIGPSFCKTYE